MRTHSSRMLLTAGLAVITILFLIVYQGSSAQQPQTPGFRALTGPAAAAFTLPSDMEPVMATHLDGVGLSYERYQQYYGPAHAEVVGGQVTIFRDATRAAVSVIGAHYPNIAPSNSVQVGRANAAEVASRDIGAAGDRTVDLVIDPATGRYAYRIETRRFDSRWVHTIDAGNGQILDKFDALAFDHGTGVKGDTKDLNGANDADMADDLTTFVSGAWRMTSKDNRQITYDARNGTALLYYPTDSDNHWNTAGTTSPGQPAIVDAQYYARQTDAYYGNLGLNWASCYAAGMKSVAHYSRNYNNAFWNGTYVVYGDGDGSIFRNLSGGLDVVAHELTHAVTDCFSKLVYSGESGALNEAFSDMMGNSAEFFVNEPTSSNCVVAQGQSDCADWWIGEDVYLGGTTVPGFRNMADPAEDGDPDHYSERYTGTGDNGGVHTNSAIPNHAFYLAVNGGQNAGCARGHAHCSGDGAVTVSPVGLEKAKRIFYTAFTALPSNATMCNARLASEAQALALYGPSDLSSVSDAWKAVGLTDSVCGIVPPPTPTPTPDGSAPTATPTNTPTPTPTNTPTPTATPTGTTTVHVGDLDGAATKASKNRWNANVTITVHNSSDAQVSGVAVTGSWSNGGTGSCTTGTSGTCQVKKSNISASTTSVTFTVTSLTGTNLIYDAASNHNADGDPNATGTSITLTRP